MSGSYCFALKSGVFQIISPYSFCGRFYVHLVALEYRVKEKVSLHSLPFRVARMICGAHFRLLASCATRLLSQRMLLVKCSLAPTHQGRTRWTGRKYRFQVFCMTRPGIEPDLPTSVVCAFSPKAGLGNWFPEGNMWPATAFSADCGSI